LRGGLQKSYKAGRADFVPFSLGKNGFLSMTQGPLEQHLSWSAIEKLERYGKFHCCCASGRRGISGNGDAEAASLLVHLGN